MAASPGRWGWHQLDAQWALWLVTEARIPAGATVVDVGAGLGALTAPLLKVGARVVAVEGHPERAQYLRQRFADSVVVVQSDARDLRLPRRPFHVVANPPFAVTTALLRRLLHPGSRMLSAHLVLQDQAAKRWVRPSAPGRGRWRGTFEVSLGLRVPRSAFRPPPSVDARVLEIRRRSGA